MSNKIAEAYINSPTNRAVCAVAEWIDANDKLDHKHYGCSWEIREDGIYHRCAEQNRVWKVESFGIERRK